MAIQYWLNRGERGRTGYWRFRGGYHGDTMATMAVCDPDEGMHSLYAGALPEHFMAELPVDAASTQALDNLLAQSAGQIAAIIVERWCRVLVACCSIPRCAAYPAPVG
ncbi:aminotransferase class III-fold pyridoxal phosphate-dependent enzyme [Komagataeibacter medellinensis]|uniref:aminotransferase class III-fold pyridoxal phosphate-dependent enzyme n=1 Tax=Komagataeibacter medellinensis TaxID=1177712 RepID=UPI00225DEDAE|nr:aminotransferase class III-fold pyridoxal phosphate-dependent enzyme [Komagataeibacter medellinensis]